MVLIAVNFQANDVCLDSKETCNNWFCKIGSVKELLPRMYDSFPFSYEYLMSIFCIYNGLAYHDSFLLAKTSDYHSNNEKIIVGTYLVYVFLFMI